MLSAALKGLGVVAMLAVWAVFSTATDGTAKTLFLTWDFPVTLFLITLIVGSVVLGVFLRVCKSVEPLQDSLALVGFWRAMPIAITQSLGFILTYMAYSKVPISLAQTLKASDPFVNLVIAHFFFTSRAPLSSWLGVIPIVIGVGMLSIDGASFDLAGFFFALASTVCFVLRSLFTKTTLKPLGPLNAYYFISWVSMVFVALLWAIVELPQLLALPGPVPETVLGTVAPSFWDSAAPSTWFISPSSLTTWVATAPVAALVSLPYLKMILSVAVFHLTYNIVSFIVLMSTSPLTHSVCNVLRRVAVIYASAVWFKTTISSTALAGTVSVFIGAVIFISLSMPPLFSSAPSETSETASGPSVVESKGDSTTSGDAATSKKLTDEEEAQPIRYTGLCSTGSRALLLAAALKTASETLASSASVKTGSDSIKVSADSSVGGLAPVCTAPSSSEPAFASEEKASVIDAASPEKPSTRARSSRGTRVRAVAEAGSESESEAGAGTGTGLEGPPVDTSAEAEAEAAADETEPVARIMRRRVRQR